MRACTNNPSRSVRNSACQSLRRDLHAAQISLFFEQHGLNHFPIQLHWPADSRPFARAFGRLNHAYVLRVVRVDDAFLFDSEPRHQ
jgi:hypothetical protein